MKDNEDIGRASTMKSIGRIVGKTLILIIIATMIMPVSGCFSSGSGSKDIYEIPLRPGAGDTITMGGYEWLVLSIEDHRALFVTKPTICRT